eukprot:CAMPEP_0202452322 /NCGR_PEP_ID=MMETSP1360-20130828/10557_1 /ASSEMBLY_ACC=CAM_ASM_000848 /TAXON_ID=515479 /ORGANISM="Licmophora paradoxa, Strain CCMP2313" /LENGTH=734 /DNA_ID=CAMNT_0049071109 /DNA_START=117 /DNA_END=2321 /DNA_ORIENTATION=+
MTIIISYHYHYHYTIGLVFAAVTIMSGATVQGVSASTSSLTSAPNVKLPTGVSMIGLTTGSSSTSSIHHDDEEGGVDAFLGIQYATIGERFGRSMMIDPGTPDTFINATSFRPNCHQAYVGLPDFLHQRRVEDEECLYLNIWRPANNSTTTNNNTSSNSTAATASSSSTSLATMVWIHGGGFAIGSGADEVHTGYFLARDENVIVVTINYRLGALGFLPQDEETGKGGMNGLYDQINALRWINQYISYFGGDPHRVTIFGESAGGESVCMLSVSPLARGLFQRAMVQSGECINNNWVHGIPNDNIQYGMNLVDQFLAVANVTSIDELKDTTKFVGSDINLLATSVGWPVIIIDKEVLPKHPRDLYSDPANIIPVDVLVGANSFEDVLFMIESPESYAGLAANIGSWIEGVIGPTYGNEAAQALVDAYSPDNNSYYNGDEVAAFAQFNGDYYIRCPSREYAAIISAASSSNNNNNNNNNHNVYLYNFAHFALTDPALFYGLYDYIMNTSAWASHLAQLPFVFGTLDFWKQDPGGAEGTEVGNLADSDYALSREIRSRWANFAKTGRPNAPEEGAVEWEPVRVLVEDSSTLTLTTTTTTSTPTPALLIPVLVFEKGVSAMKDLSMKAQQCASFPFLTFLSSSLASHVDNIGVDDETSSPPSQQQRMPSAAPSSSLSFFTSSATPTTTTTTTPSVSPSFPTTTSIDETSGGGVSFITGTATSVTTMVMVLGSLLLGT